MDTATLILFAIRGAARLGQEAHTAYVDMTRNRDLILPLPGDDATLSRNEAFAFFRSEQGRQFVEGNGPVAPRSWLALSWLRTATGPAHMDAHPEEAEKLPALAREALGLIEIHERDTFPPNRSGMSRDDLVALASVSGWEAGLSAATPFQRMAGTLVEIGVDYALLEPGLFDTRSSTGRALHALVTGLDSVDFARGSMEELPARLFAVALETASLHPDAFCGGANTRELVGATAGRLAELVTERSEAIAEDSSLTATQKRDKRTDLGEWSELVFRGVLDAAGSTALSDPGRFLGVQGVASQELVTEVGNGVLELMLQGESVSLDPIFARAGTERLLRTALDVVARHPRLVTNTNQAGVNAILSSVSSELVKKQSLLAPDMVPEVTRLILEKTGDNLNLLWPQAPARPETNLLMTAATATLSALSAPDGSAPWHPDFTREDLLFVMETVFDEVNANPGWITDDNQYLNTALKRALAETVTCFKRQDVTISGDTAAVILADVVKGVALQRELLHGIDYHDEVRTVAGAAIDAVVHTLFKADPKVKWQLCRDETLTAIISVLFEELAESSSDEQAVSTLRSIAKDLATEIKSGRALDLDVLRTVARERLGIRPALEA
ncbi:hypothetical protein [Pseudodesulfovibrio tunisiensis]|uniref:hypothetical protein n=1 Tax=Pseudodesulfovibrio tunisiensis TaxID=463192 RepID=UPI001FB429BF|nr:hypothetical protein [Pseudodesulfovibrio tunisiensis]